MKRRILLLSVIILLFSGCNDNNSELHLDSELFRNLDTANCIISYFNFDCSSCIAAMQRTDEILQECSNVYYIVSTHDSIRTSYHLDMINTNATIIFDNRRKFVKENRIFGFSEKYPVFILRNGKLSYCEDPFANFLNRLVFLSEIKDFRRDKQ